MRHPALMLLPLLFATAATPVEAQPMPGDRTVAVPATFDAGARREIVAKLGEALHGRYAFPEVGERAAAKIEAALAAGDYDGLADPDTFATRLTADVYAIAHDKHFRVWGPGGSPVPRPANGGPPPRAEAGIVRADKLAGDIGYLELIEFPPPGPFNQVLDKAMAALAGSRALIIDERRNIGGAAGSVAYLLSYLVAPDRPLSGVISRIPNTKDFTTRSFRSVATPISFATVPVYVLTSKATFSGGEAFAYDLQALGRGTVIGEVTGGGANPVGPADLGHGFGAMIPFARAENPVTKTNWEGRGVQPDVVVPAEGALAAALERAGQKPVGEIGAASLSQIFAPRTMAHPGSEAALRALLAGYASGKPDYEAMAPEFADMTRQQLPALQAQLAPLGELQSLVFRGPDMMGGDEYALHFAKGDRMMALVVGPEGKILAVSSPMPLPPAP